MTTFNEDSRVKIPALLHLERPGYRYLSLKDASWGRRNNVFNDILGAAPLSNSHGRVKPQAMIRLQVSCCPRIAEQFGELVTPLPWMRMENVRQNLDLTQLRDWVLPLLMNGRLRMS